jgi:predicted nucleotidyltransferase component of viral defense system
MSINIINERIQQYKPESKQDEINAFKEIAQEITLLALSRANFFKQGAFQGGTCLRIIYGLPRFSEDLDFILYQPNHDFKWKTFTDEVLTEFSLYGLSVEIKERSEASEAVKKAFLKDNSFGKVLNLKYERTRADTQSINIKLEVDTNPPVGPQFESKLITFPTPFSIIAQNIPSLFAGKIHALLCRPYSKGRDWYDFIWYVNRKAAINISLLRNALFQQGPWASQKLNISKGWIIETLANKIETIDWETAKKDVISFIKPREKHSVQLWDKVLFMHFINLLNEYL